MQKFDIIGRRKIWYTLSLLVIIPGIICMFVRGFNLGIDFTGGTIMDLKFAKPVTITEIRDVLKDYKLDNSMIQLSGENSSSEVARDVMIRTVDLQEKDRKEVMNSLKTHLGDYEVMREEKVGATMGSELMLRALWATLLSWGMIVLYISYRFEFKFGVSAVLGLVHDILIVLSVFSLLQKPVDASFIAALMTIVGYSANDTIVIFDRVRENLKLHFRRDGNIEELVNTSIYQTLTRSIYTVSTVLFTTFALYFFGGDTTKDFAFALLIGFAVGAYSSIFVASPLWVTFREWSNAKRARKQTAAAK